jgi:uncharacterized protein YqgV (UPF0045/DUF77 family)
MNISVEISYYPLTGEFDKPINEFIDLLKNRENISVDIGTMSTLISGDYDEVMALLNHSLKELMTKYPSVFNLKIANACEIG